MTWNSLRIGSSSRGVFSSVKYRLSSTTPGSPWKFDREFQVKSVEFEKRLVQSEGESTIVTNKLVNGEVS